MAAGVFVNHAKSGQELLGGEGGGGDGGGCGGEGGCGGGDGGCDGGEGGGGDGGGEGGGGDGGGDGGKKKSLDDEQAVHCTCEVPERQKLPAWHHPQPAVLMQVS